MNKEIEVILASISTLESQLELLKIWKDIEVKFNTGATIPEPWASMKAKNIIEEMGVYKEVL